MIRFKGPWGTIGYEDGENKLLYQMLENNVIASF
jgi:hypothetical protein